VSKPVGLQNWTVPQELDVPSYASAQDVAPQDGKMRIEEPPPEAKHKPDEVNNSGLDMGLLLNLLGSQNPNIAPIIGLLNGDKPDIMALLPLLTQLGQKKTSTESETPKPFEPKVTNLDEYQIV